MRLVFDFLKTNDLPLLTRVNYAAELRQMALWGIVAGGIEGSIASIVASKTFHASPTLTSIVWALPVLINVINVGWSAIIRGRPRKPLFMLLASGVILGVATIGLNASPDAPWAGWIFAAQIAFAHLFNSGFVTLRTTIWKVNYPTECRARIAGRLQALRILVTVLKTSGLALLFDRNPQNYVWMYPLIGACGVLSLLPIRRLRVRGEAAELESYRQHVETLAERANSSAGASFGIREALDVLRTDRRFARYMLAQFLLGAANFYCDPILVIVITKQWEFPYSAAQGLMFILPMAFLLVSISAWANFFDRVGVLRFRVYSSTCWLIWYIFAAVGMALIDVSERSLLVPGLLLLFAGRVIHGIGRGGAAIAWPLGHLHFARKHQTEIYMGIHVGLTGLRGLLMPQVGWLAYANFGWYAFLVPVALTSASIVMFRRMAREDTTAGAETASGDEATPTQSTNLSES